MNILHEVVVSAENVFSESMSEYTLKKQYGNQNEGADWKNATIFSILQSFTRERTRHLHIMLLTFSAPSVSKDDASVSLLI